MWVRKNKQEILKKNIKTRFNPIFSITIAFLGSLVHMMATNDPLGAFWELFIITFIVAYIGQLLFRDVFFILGPLLSNTASNDKYDICNSCNKVQNKNTDRMCSCGGEKEPIENWKWIDEK